MNAARAVLISRPNSHPFQERDLSLDQPVKVGRSVARARAANSNAIFDCKVLSRHHALLWYENGKFFLQDTKSSNGTFVNNNRLSTNESEPHEVSSGDIVQFGVDVMENNRKVTHGCIVATLKLYLPDGKEAKASPSVAEGGRHGLVPLDELYKLNQIIQEASQRELCLETKLTALQHVVDAARRAADEHWQAYVGEERLLSRVAALESQLTQAGKGFGEDRLRDELRQLQEDRGAYQTAAKDALMKAHTERLEAIAAAAEQERARAAAENEALLAREHWERAQQELQEVAHRVVEEQRKADAASDQHEQRIKELQARLEELQVGRETCVERLASEEVDEVNEPNDADVDNDADTEIMKYERILNEAMRTDDDNTRNEADSDEVTFSDVQPSPLPASIAEGDNGGVLAVVENKDELDTQKEASSEESSAAETVGPPVGEADTRTLKYQYQTVCEQKRHIEQLELLSSANKTRIALLEKSLLNEKEEKSYLLSKVELLKEECAALEEKYVACLNESKELHDRVFSLKAEQVESAKVQAPRPDTAEHASQAASDDTDTVEECSTRSRHAAKLAEQLTALEDEVVALKERYASVTEEKIALNKEVLRAHDKYNTLCNRSHNTLFFYVGPLALMVLYLLVSSMFSWFTAILLVFFYFFLELLLKIIKET